MPHVGNRLECVELLRMFQLRQGVLFQNRMWFGRCGRTNNVCRRDGNEMDWSSGLGGGFPSGGYKK